MSDEKTKYTSAEMQKWLFKKAQETKDPNVARRIIAGNELRGRPTTRTGRVYFFKYDPKGKYELPQYDKFPLCVPIEKYNDGFLGLNLHYLQQGNREKLLKTLLETRSDHTINDQTIMRISYDAITASTKLERLAGPAIHRYLFAHVRSKFIEVYPDEYDIALQLPIEQWVFNH
jgi:hypothetical protein